MQVVWKNFSSWLRTIRPDVHPSESVPLSLDSNWEFTFDPQDQGEKEREVLEFLIRGNTDAFFKFVHEWCC